MNQEGTEIAVEASSRPGLFATSGKQQQLWAAFEEAYLEVPICCTSICSNTALASLLRTPTSELSARQEQWMTGCGRTVRMTNRPPAQTPRHFIARW